MAWTSGGDYAPRCMKPPPRRSTPGPARRVVGAVFTVGWMALVVVAPLAAAWVASSRAAHAGWSVGAVAAAGLLVFPVLPGLWEALASWRRARRGTRGRRFFTRTDRLVLRTLAVSLAVIVGLVVHDPPGAFGALTRRGDWMLDGRHDPHAETARRGLRWTAERFAGLARVTDDTPLRPGTETRPLPRPLPTEETAVAPPRDPRAWPWDETLHPAVAALSPADETSPEAVGRALAAAEPDPWKLARAVHDYVSDRVAYDVASYRTGVYPPQDALTTFRTRLSVCAGYAALFEAIGRAAGLTIETVTGRARGMVTTGMGEGHAWSAVRLDGRWHLVDTTWDAGYVDAEGFHKRYRTHYFLTPPEVFVAKHFPDEPRWQLLPTARTEGEYMRAPALDPGFFAQGLRLVRPDRAESDARGEVVVTVDNPRGVSVMVTVRPDGGPSSPCPTTGDAVVTARCPLRGGDLHEVVFLTAARRVGTHWSVGAVRVHNR